MNKILNGKSKNNKRKKEEANKRNSNNNSINEMSLGVLISLKTQTKIGMWFGFYSVALSFCPLLSFALLLCDRYFISHRNVTDSL